ncbi:MMPL family transporter [Actinomadura rudentiformis]|uniref:MMPL family transporter n=1 Tax=Actinomadura rudentiformis TaxID=359158 RepID=A0A6H9YS30_9ACTN|nr:MMPL family transporter [Actinomadura rudentiformis]KAB2348081.1 MMPL family transporter [Actinomadura rudentiformis]
MLARLGRFAFMRRGPVVLVWLMVLAGTIFAGLTAASVPDDDFKVPGVESQRAFDLLQERFPGMAADAGGATMVFVAPQGQKVTAGPYKTAIESAVKKLSGGGQVAGVDNPFTSDAVSRDGSAAYANVNYKVPASGVTAGSRAEIAAASDTARKAGLTVEAGGSAMEAGGGGGTAELIAIGLAAVILLITFGSLVAAGLPLVTALLGVSVSMLGILAVSATFGLSATTGAMALMLGLAVGIDYALFVVSRYREERTRGLSAVEAVSLAMGTAGSAVAFAGLTVVIALAGLAVVGIPMLTKMGLAAVAAVVVAVLVTLTLVPAVLGFMPDKVLPRSARRKAGKRTAEAAAEKAPGRGGTRWARLVLRNPVAVLLLGVISLGVLALPALTASALGLTTAMLALEAALQADRSSLLHAPVLDAADTEIVKALTVFPHTALRAVAVAGLLVAAGSLAASRIGNLRDRKDGDERPRPAAQHSEARPR